MPVDGLVLVTPCSASPASSASAQVTNALDCMPLVLGADKSLAESAHGIFVRMTDEDGSRSYVSRRHAELLELRGSLVLRDLGSVNGTYLNGERLQSGSLSRTLQSGDVFTLSVHPCAQFRVVAADCAVSGSLPEFVPRLETATKSLLSFLRDQGFRRFLQATQPLSEDERKTLVEIFAETSDAETRKLLAEAVGLGRRATVQRHLATVAANLGLQSAENDLCAVCGFLGI